MKLKPRASEEPDLNLTSLIDVVLLLLIFFMVSTTFVVVLASMEARSSSASGERVGKPMSCTVLKRSSGARFSSKPQPDRPPVRATMAARRDGIRRRC